MSGGRFTDRIPIGRQWLTLLLVGLVLLVGCKESLYSNLNEQEANEMLVVLAQAGLDARKVRLSESSWAVEVESSDLAIAVEGLKRAGLPRQRFSNLGEMFKREGIVSTPTEERVRFIHGVSQELSNTLSTIDGVTSAHVHIAIPQNDPLSDKVLPSSASVFVKHHSGLDLQPLLPSIKSLVLRSVEGLTYDTVYVSMVPSAPVPTDKLSEPMVPLLGIKVPSAHADWINPALLAAISIPLLLLGYLTVYYRNALSKANRQVARLRGNGLSLDNQQTNASQSIEIGGSPLAPDAGD